jgi:hypothetical protein
MLRVEISYNYLRGFNKLGELKETWARQLPPVI